MSRFYPVFLHKKENIKNHLPKSWKLDSANTKDILNDIFGYAIGGISFEGLVSATNDANFDYRLHSCQERWNRVSPWFVDWFIKNESQIFKTRMIFEVRNRALIKKTILTTKLVESKHSALKDWVYFSRSSLPDFNIKFSKFIDWQNMEAEKSLYSQVQYTLDDKYSDLKVEYKVCKRMDVNVRQKHTRLYWNQKVTTSDNAISFESKKSDVMEEKLIEKTISAAIGSDETDYVHGNQSLDTKQCLLDHVDLDILSDSISVQRETVRNIAKKAMQLLNEENVIVDAPGVSNTKIVASQTKH